MLKKDKIGKSAAKSRIEERSTASPKGRRAISPKWSSLSFYFKKNKNMVKIWSIP
nr:MAG TPA: hypothetical protein [Caudoviricetes sp.]